MKLRLLPASVREWLARRNNWKYPTRAEAWYHARNKVFNYQRAHRHPAMVSAARRGKMRRT